ncbi:MAG TPA: immunoglobulin domain-containing protein [Verrucomicrobiae bacterium]|jgi:hypothetical protein
MSKIKSWPVIATAAVLAFSPAVRAQIAYLDNPTAIEYNGASTLNGASVTVSPGASVLVVIYGSRTQGDSPSADPGVPASIQWNGNPMIKAVAQGDLGSTWDDNAIYYLINPPAGAGQLTGVLPSTVTQNWWMAYTLSGVNTNIGLLTGTASTTSGTTINNTVANVSPGDWAAVATSDSSAGETLVITTTPTGPAVLTATYGSSGNATQTMGSVSNLAAGGNKFISTSSGAGGTTLKITLAEAIFTPYVPPPLAPSFVSVTAGNPAQVDLSWTASAGASTYILERGETSGGPYTDATNILFGTSFIDSNVVSGTAYYYIVAAANAAGTNFSGEQSATPVGSPFAPVLGAGATGANTITLHWTASFGATNYIIERSTASGAETSYAATTNHIFVDTGLAAGTAYYYEIEAAGIGGTSGVSDESSALALGSDWFLFDNFSEDTVNAALNGQTGSAGLGTGWVNLGGGAPILVTNSSTFGGANYAQYTPSSAANIGDYEAGLGIPGNSTASTVFLEFSLPGIQDTIGNAGLTTASNLVAMNFDIDNSSPPGALTGSSATGPSAQFNYDNSTGDGFFRVNGAGTFYYATISPNNTPYLPTPGDVYYFWFVLNATKGTYQIYLANGSMTGTNLDSGGLGAAPTLMWGATSTTGNGSVITYGFRNVSSGGSAGLPINYIGTGPGSTLGTVAQNEFANIYVDPHSQNLTNPVTGLAAVGTPEIFTQPQPVQVYAGASATFTVFASAGVGFQWQSNGVNLADVGTVSGSAASSLTISNVTAADQANYTCIVDNPASAAFAATTPASLTVVTPNGSYETAVAAAGASHYYAFNDQNSTPSGTAAAYDFAGGDNGVYGANVANGPDGITGPTLADGFIGFSATNFAASFVSAFEPDNVTIESAWNLETNAVTITAWINPTTSTEANSTAIVMNRGSGNDVEGLIFNTSGHFTLGYEWNNDANTASWDSGLVPPPDQWSFVSLVVTPVDATISMMTTNGVLSSTHTYPHPVEPFAGTTMIGDDPGSAVGLLTFNGTIDEVGIFNQALSQTALQTFFTDASGLANFPATNSVTLVTPEPAYPGQTAQFSSVYGGSGAMTFTWQINGANVSDGASSVGTIIGSATPNLIISNLASADAGQSFNATLVTSNAFGVWTSTVPAILAVSAASPPQSIVTTGMEAGTGDWNTGTSWSDGLPASASVFAAPGSAYFIAPATLERSPATTNAAFPGDTLVLQGDGNLLDGNASSFATETTTGELRLKQSGANTTNLYGTIYTLGGNITFPDLQLAGGQIDNGNSSVVNLYGQIDVLSNSAFYADSAAAASIRSFVINALLTGSGTVTYNYLGTLPANNDLVISGANNTFSGQWNIVSGGLVGNAPNSLGTNSITVGGNGALETTYDLNIPNANLVLNGQMYLYTDDTVFGLVIDGFIVPPGAYTFAQLNASYPSTFPAAWPVQLGSTTGANTGAGSITVLAELPPIFSQQPTSLSLYPGQTAQFVAISTVATNYQWWFTNANNVAVKLSDGNGISGSATEVLTITNVSDANAGTYVLVAANAGGPAASAAATLTILTTSPDQIIATLEMEAAGTDWNTAASWSDGLAASVSVYAEPGSAYYITPGTLERTPTVPVSAFPGNTLVIQGDGNLIDGNSAAFPLEVTTGELRLKESGTTLATNFGTAYVQGGSVTFPDLQLAGGQIDNGNASEVALNGEIDVLNNSSIYSDSAANGSIRSIEINALLTGSGTLTFAYLSSNSINNDLVIAGAANTFSGQWNIVQGGLLGSAPNSLGTNSINISTNAMLETTYNYTSTNGTLTLVGQMYLHTADTFFAVTVNGTSLSPGTYSFAQLNSAYPSNFPASWPVQLGSSTGAGSGSLTVLTGPAAAAQAASFGGIRFSGTTLTVSGSNGAPFGTFHLLTTTNLAIPVKSWTVLTNGSYDASGNFSLTIPETPGDSHQFYSVESP